MTSPNNPYAPPAATVADVVPADDTDFQPVKIFSASGRLGRMRFFAYMFAANFILNIASSILGMIIGVGAAASGVAPQTMTIISMALAAIFTIPALIFYVMLGIRRSHDMNLSGWFVLLTFIPLAVLYWLFAPGTQGRNRFGAPPPPNSTGVQVLFWIAIFFMALGLILMIVAIGAFMYLSGR